MSTRGHCPPRRAESCMYVTTIHRPAATPIPHGRQPVAPGDCHGASAPIKIHSASMRPACLRSARRCISDCAAIAKPALRPCPRYPADPDPYPTRRLRGARLPPMAGRHVRDYYKTSAPPRGPRSATDPPIGTGCPARRRTTEWFPRSRSNRSIREAPSSTPAASPRLRRRPSTWPPRLAPRDRVALSPWKCLPG